MTTNMCGRRISGILRCHCTVSHDTIVVPHNSRWRIRIPPVTSGPRQNAGCTVCDRCILAHSDGRMRPRRRGLSLRIASLGVAAGLATACGGTGDSALLEALPTVIRGQRLVEPRLATDPTYGTCQRKGGTERFIASASCSELPRPTNSDFDELYGPIREIREAHLTAPSPATAHARGAAALLFPDIEPSVALAVSELERLAKESPANATIQSDLSAAYIVRAGVAQNPLDLIRALDAAQRAVALKNDLAPALFNRGVAAERLDLRTTSSTAWLAYLRVDSISLWAAEVRNRLRRNTIGIPDTPLVTLFEEQLDRSDSLSQLARAFPQDARLWAMDHLLPSWAAALDELSQDNAAEYLNAARLIATALANGPGDRTVRHAVASIERSVESGHLGTASAISGHLEYGRARALIRAGNWVDAQTPLQHARSALQAIHSPLAMWADIWAAGNDLYGGRAESAIARFSSIRDQAHSDEFPALVGRAEWGLGLLRARQGRFTESVALLGSAQRLFSSAGEQAHAGTIHSLLAENLRMVGESQGAWRHRYEALRALAHDPTSIWYHNTLVELAKASTDLGLPWAALAIQNEALHLAQLAQLPQMAAEALILRSYTERVLGRLHDASRDLKDARNVIESLPDSVLRMRAITDLILAEAAVASEGDRGAGTDALDNAVRYFLERGDSANLGVVLTDRARTHSRRSQYHRANRDLAQAIGMLERRAASLPGDSFTVAFASQVQDVFDDMIHLQLNHIGDTALAFTYLERARVVLSSWPLDSGHGQMMNGADQTVTTGHVTTFLKRYAPNAVVLEYAVLRDSVFAWMITADTVAVWKLPKSSRDIDQTINRYLSALQQRNTSLADTLARRLGFDLLPFLSTQESFPNDLIIIPDKILYQLPFATLRNPTTGRFLVEDWSITMGPSATFHLGAMARARGTSVSRQPQALVVGDPTFDRAALPWLSPLSGATREAEQLAAMYPSATVLTGNSATKAAILASSSGVSMFHYAGHAVHNAGQPANSFLALAVDTSRGSLDLYAYEFAQLALSDQSLVVLSACNTATSAGFRGTGLTALAGPFIQAGAGAVLGTLWEVNDDVVGELSVAFHRYWIRGLNVQRALREAQVAMIQSTDIERSNPLAWGSFQVVGALN